MSDATTSSQAKTFAETFADAAETLNSGGMDLLFRQARTHNVWAEKPVSDTLLRRVHDLMKMAPTSMNMCPARIVFVKSDAAKQRLKSALVPGNIEKTMTAPVCAIIGHDLEAWEHLPKLFPYKDMSGMFRENPVMAAEAAFRNGSLQGGYFILAARALGLDCGPMSGFDNAAVDREFFDGTTVRSNFLCNLGYGARGGSYQRAPRFDFEEVCEIL